MKNILIITTTRDNLGSHIAFVSDINDISEEIVRKMIKNCINGVKWEEFDFWTNGKICGSERGYIFNNHTLLSLPVTVEHIVNYVF